MNLIERKAQIEDLPEIIFLLVDDELGRKRESNSKEVGKSYLEAFHKINNDPNQYLMVICNEGKIVGTCHCTLMPSLTFKGSTRMQIEAVRVCSTVRGKSVGSKMIELAVKWGRSHGATIFQLTTNKERKEAIKFYEKFGFKATHEGMKIYIL